MRLLAGDWSISLFLCHFFRILANHCIDNFILSQESKFTSSNIDPLPDVDPLPDKMEDSKIYLDYNATTPLAPEVLQNIHTALRDFWGNPSSGHDAGAREPHDYKSPGRISIFLCVGVQARSCIAGARASVARMINVPPSDIVFTSGGTEV